jgi:hypothetical protein
MGEALRPQLAMRLVADTMGWDDTDATREFPWLQLMADYKYDRYQGYGPGVHFFISLIHWLGQFPDKTSRNTAYQFLRKRLIFVGQAELHQLIKLAMPEIQKDARHLVAGRLGFRYFETWTSQDAQRDLRLMALRTLYIGLSDGARIDVFRRDNDGLVSNEQIVASSEFSDQKWNSLEKKLKERLKENGFEEAEPRFERVCLIDDFTGSGSTLIRLDGTEWDGKVVKFCFQNSHRRGRQLTTNCHIQIHHYISSTKAKKIVEDTLRDYQATTTGFSFGASFSWVLSHDIVIDDNTSPLLLQWINNHYDSSIQTTHNCKDGKPIMLGYKQCGLPLVLEHNTPNNSIALVWATSKGGSSASHIMRPLFPRKDRHVDHGQSL